MAQTIIQYLDEIATTFLSCVCVAASGNPSPPQHCCLRIGDQVVHDADIYTDLCCEGLAYVTVGDIYPVVASFPEQSSVTQADQICSFPSWGINMAAGIIRCAPTGTSTTMPTCDDWTAAALQDLYDAQTLATAACCFKQAWLSSAHGTGMSVVINTSSTSSPQGGCKERTISLTVQTTVCPGC